MSWERSNSAIHFCPRAADLSSIVHCPQRSSPDFSRSETGACLGGIVRARSIGDKAVEQSGATGALQGRLAAAPRTVG